MESKSPENPREALRQKLASMKSARTGAPTKKALSKEIKSAKKSAKEAGRHAEQALTDPHARFAEQVIKNAFTGESERPTMQQLLADSDGSSSNSGSDSDSDIPTFNKLSQMEPLTGTSSGSDDSDCD